ncbi:MAG TPA: nickel pincer cofactor biosynthesis protein LarC [Desulfobulbaceae bacterium]|nr:nickel pincer cofactor biosynthesis protein LarC [Desulfobulbaceae bacterium]
MNIAYLDCFSGISGDMLLGALVDAGLPAAELHALVPALGLKGCRLDIDRTMESPLRATRVAVLVDNLQPPRHLPEIETILNKSGLSPVVREKSLAVFLRLAEAEAEVHGCAISEVHFHEVGAADALIDIVGAVRGLHLLSIDKLFCSPLPMPRGWTDCAHGRLPLPAPAVCALLRGVPVYGDEIDQELVTPTGAALVRTLAEGFGPLPPMLLTETGYGAGSRKRSDGQPNLLRLLIGEEYAPAEAQQVEVIETALDDWSPESWPYVAEKLLQAGALDVLLMPVQMKKGRPGFLVRVISTPAGSEAAKIILLSETSAIGLRCHSEQRRTLPREIVTLQTKWGTVRGKKISTPTGVVITPEYEECRRLAAAHGVPIRLVYEEVSRCAGNSNVS